MELAKLGEQMTPETLLEEIELGDRLDARIDRLVKRLLHLKTAKQMIDPRHVRRSLQPARTPAGDPR